MSQDFFSIITNAGLIKNAAANSSEGSKVSLTHLAIGDSNGTYYNPTGTATSLKNECYRTTITHVVVDEDNPNQLIVEAVIKEEVGPFYIREVGVYDSSGELFAIGKYPETFKPDLPAGSGKRLYIRMILGFASSPQVNLLISTDINNDPNFSTTVNNALAQRVVRSKNLADLDDAIKARDSLGLKNGAITNFTGAVMPFAMPIAPLGWLECNGTAVLIASYPSLASAIYCGDVNNSTAIWGYKCTDPANPTTSRSISGQYIVIPDLRGEFVRGWDNNRGVDNGRAFGSNQSDAIRNITGTIYGPSGINATGAFTVSPAARLSGGFSSSVREGTTTFDASTVVPTASENRPRNIALMYCIKY